MFYPADARIYSLLNGVRTAIFFERLGGLSAVAQEGRGTDARMLYFDKQPADAPLRKWSALLNPKGAEPVQGDFPRLGDVAISREKTLVEELFSFDGPPDATVSVGGQEYYYFSGEGYLGLQANPEVLAATCEAVLRYGTSLGTIRRRFTPAPVFEVERQTAEIYGTDRAFYTSDEAAAAERLLESISDSFETVFIDELVSDTLYAAVERALAPTDVKPIRFRHRDTNHLKELLDKKLAASARPLVITDGVFNVTGTIAPIPDYYAVLAEYHDSALFIDDSDAFGILGEKGRGTLEYFDYDTRQVNRTRLDGDGDPMFGIDYCTNALDVDFSSSEGNRPEYAAPDERRTLPDDIFGDDEQLPETDELKENDDFIFLQPERKKRAAVKPLPVRTYCVASLSRAVGGFGAVVSGSERFIDRLKNGSQAGLLPPTPLAAATCKGLQLSFHHDMIRHRLWNNVYYFKTELEKLGLVSEPNMVPIVSIRTGTDGNMRRLQRELINGQILVSFLQRINARRREGSLRVALFATHERAMLDLFLETLKQNL